MKLADEIRGMITGFPKPLDADNAPYSEGFMTATIKAAQLVEKREAERADSSLIERARDVLGSVALDCRVEYGVETCDECEKSGFSLGCKLKKLLSDMEDAK